MYKNNGLSWWTWTALIPSYRTMLDFNLPPAHRNSSNGNNFTLLTAAAGKVFKYSCSQYISLLLLATFSFKL